MMAVKQAQRRTAGKLAMLLTLFFLFKPADTRAAPDLTEMSLESLMDIEVTSVAKKKQKVSDSAAAVYVITREDIRRSGATSLAEAVRMAPGMHVARINGNAWAVSARGFNSIIANKLLVLIDGRTVYNPVFSGVHWGQQDIILADIDRIEVIRGPGGTLWGANAVNGVINIITRPAAETQGGLLEAGVGNPNDGFGAIRYGDKLGTEAYYRVYGKHFERGSLETATGTDANDDGSQSQIGTRIDWSPTPRDNITLTGNAFDGEFGQNLFLASLTPPGMQFFNDTGDKRGGNALMRWTHGLRSGAETRLQLYFDSYERDSLFVGEAVDTWDVEFQHRSALNERLELLWGLGYRRSSIDLDDGFFIQFDQNSRELDTFSSFIQGDFDITDDIQLTLGSKFEHNDFTGFEYQPNARLHWHPVAGHTVWGAISRAVRTPNIIEDSSQANISVVTAPGFPPQLFTAFGSPAFESEELLAFELGYRAQLHSSLSFDIAAFYNDYENLLSRELNPNPVLRADPIPHLLFQVDTANQLYGESYGLEALVEWQVTGNWRLSASYSVLEMNLDRKPTSNDAITGMTIEGSDPEQQVKFRSFYNLTSNIELDATLYWVDQLPAQNVDDYLRLDLHLGWHPTPDLELGLFAQNILDDRHQEFNEPLFLSSEVPRAVFGRVRLAW